MTQTDGATTDRVDELEADAKKRRAQICALEVRLRAATAKVAQATTAATTAAAGAEPNAHKNGPTSEDSGSNDGSQRVAPLKAVISDLEATAVVTDARATALAAEVSSLTAQVQQSAAQLVAAEEERGAAMAGLAGCRAGAKKVALAKRVLEEKTKKLEVEVAELQEALVHAAEASSSNGETLAEKYHIGERATEREVMLEGQLQAMDMEIAEHVALRERAESAVTELVEAARQAAGQSEQQQTVLEQMAMQQDELEAAYRYHRPAQ